MARICLITPGHLSTNPRIVKEADALSEAGHEVRVIAAEYATWARDADAEFEGRPWLAKESLMFGPGAPFFVRLNQVARQRIAQFLVRLGWRGDRIDCAAFHPVAPALRQAALRTPADLYIAHYVAALPAAAAAAARHGARYAFDAEDFHLGDLPDVPEHAFAKALIQGIEGRYLPGCAYVSAASPGIADAYAQTYGLAPPTIVLNVFPLQDGPGAVTRKGAADRSPSVYWFSQTIGPDRGLECAVRAIGHAKSRPHLYLLGRTAAGYQQRLLDLAEATGCHDRVHFLPTAPPLQMVRIAARYDIGLASETGNTPSRERALTNKLFTYMLAGLPVVISDTPAQKKFAVGLESCLWLYPRNDAQALADGLDHFLLDAERLAAARSAAWALGQGTYNWDKEKRIILGRIETMLHGSAARSATPHEIHS
ncbi:MAG: hypothetical protein JWM36_1683 [Hyphomicrobiales bacterium]|nr:hypothetical protein [Hyphomicrobiales bacterium]